VYFFYFKKNSMWLVIYSSTESSASLPTSLKEKYFRTFPSLSSVNNLPFYHSLATHLKQHGQPGAVAQQTTEQENLLLQLQAQIQQLGSVQTATATTSTPEPSALDARIENMRAKVSV
jgi:hypothetical protein